MWNVWSNRILPQLRRLKQRLVNAMTVRLIGRAQAISFPQSTHRATTTTVHVIDQMGLGGAQRQLLHWMNSEPNCKLIAVFRGDGHYQAELKHLGIPLLVLDEELSRHHLLRILARLDIHLARALTLRRHLDRIQAVRIYAWLPLSQNICALAEAGSNRQRAAIHRNQPSHRPGSTREHLLNRLSQIAFHRHVGNARAVADDWVRCYASAPDSVRVIPNVLDITAFVDRPRSPASPPIILTVGRCVGQKRQDLLIQASAILDNLGRTIQTVIAGDGHLRNDLIAQIKKYDLGDSCRVTGACEDPREWYAQASIFVLCSDYEGMPNVIMEAMAFGLPIITTPAGGATELIGHNSNGIVVPCNDAATLANAIACFLDHPAWARSLGDAARESINDKRPELLPHCIASIWSEKT